VVGGTEKADVTGTEVSASVSLGMLDNGGFGLAVELDVHLPNLDHDVVLGVGRHEHLIEPLPTMSNRRSCGRTHRCSSR
jgi:osmotically inducible protein OsmC